jgi:hypothetical protein
MIVACLALFLAIGGSGYAASRIVTPAPNDGASASKRSQQKAIKKAVAKYIAAHKSEFVGPRGNPGEIGPMGPPGSPGATGEVGPAGLTPASDRLAGPVSTGSSSSVDLGGPEVTVNVGPSGLVAFWATATMKASAGTARVHLSSNNGGGAQIETTLSSPIKLFTLPDAVTGTNHANAGLSTLYVGPGPETFSLRYSDTAGTGTFEDVELVVIPF